MEVFGLSVDVELFVSNLERIANQVRARLNNVSIEPKVKEIKVEAKTGEMFKGMSGELGRALQRMSGTVSGTLGQVMGAFSGIKLEKKKPKKEGDEEAGGMGMLGTAGKAGIVAGAAVAGVAILKMIHDRIGKMVEKLAEISPSFKGMQDLTEKIWNLAMKPMADFMTILMKPYITLAMQVLRPQLQKMYATIKASGGKITPEVTTQLTSIWEETTAALGETFGSMMSLIQPFAAKMDGFLAAIGAVFNNWLTGIGSWIQGLADGIAVAFRPMADVLAQRFLDAATKGEDAFSMLPANMHERFFQWVIANPGKLPQIAGDVREEMWGWIMNNPENLKLLTGDVATSFKDWLTTGEGADALKGLPKKAADDLNKWLTDENAKKYWTDAMSGAATSLGTTLTDAGKTIGTTWDTFTTNLKTALETVINNVKNVLTNAPTQSFYSNPANFVDTGTVSTPKTTANPIISIITQPVKNLVNLAQAAYKTVAPILGFKSYQEGTPFVPETGPAILHKGETVLPPQKAAEYREKIKFPNINNQIQANIPNIKIPTNAGMLQNVMNASNSLTNVSNTARSVMNAGAQTILKPVVNVVVPEKSRTPAPYIQPAINPIQTQTPFPGLSKTSENMSSLMVRNMSDMVAGINALIGKRSYAQGTDFVPETGVAFLHKGEAVLPARQASAFRASGGKSVTINLHPTINSNVKEDIDADAIVRRMNRETELQMRSLGLI